MEIRYLISAITLSILVNTLSGDSVQLDDPHGEWVEILDTFSDHQVIRSAFTELRKNPFHRVPRRFEGQFIWHPEKGLSLRYTQPSDLTVNIDFSGVHVLRDDGPVHIQPNGEQENTMLLFSKLFEWDIEWLSSRFRTDGEIKEDRTWELRLRPVDASLAKKIGRIDLSGTAILLERIRLDLSGGKTVEIILKNQERPAVLSDSERALAYPFDNDG